MVGRVLRWAVELRQRLGLRSIRFVALGLVVLGAGAF